MRLAGSHLLIAGVAALAACSSNGTVLSSTALACDSDSQCPEGRVCTAAGRCLEPSQATLTLLGAEPFAPNALRVSFEQSLGAAPGRANFILSAEVDGASLEVLGAERSPEDPRVALVYTNSQIPGSTYELRVFGLVGDGGEETPDAGLSTLFTGYVEPPNPRSLALFTPSSVSQGEAFEITVLARNDEDLSAYVDMSAELTWSLGATGEVTVVDAPGWDQGSQTYTLVIDADPPLADGEAKQVTLSASTSDGSSIDGTSEIFELRGAVALREFQITGPTFAQVGELFAIDVRAIGSDGELFEDYTGRVSLAPNSGIGDLTPEESQDFVDGEATVFVSYDVLTPELAIEVTDIEDTSKVGRSDAIQVGLTDAGAAAPTLTALPVSATQIRLDWTIVPEATRYAVEVSIDGGPYSDLTTLVSGLYRYTHGSLAEGTPYRYRLQAWNAEALLASLEAEATPTAPTHIITEVIDTPTVLTVDDSPYRFENPTVGKVIVTSSFTIEAGVVVLFPDDGGFDFTGPGAAVSVDGTPERPVHLAPERVGEPWGGLRIRSDIQGTEYAPDSQNYLSGSRLSNVIIDHASGVAHALQIAVPLDVTGLLMRHNRPSDSTVNIETAGFQVTLSHSRFIQNEHSVYGLGGSGRLYLNTNAWLFNESNLGGGAWFANTPGTVGTAWVYDRGSLYLFNESDGFGGAINLSGNAKSRIEDSVFINNLSSNSGGAIVANASGAISRCRFENNIALGEDGAPDGRGGAVDMVFGGPVRDSVFLNNRAVFGGAISCNTGGIEATNVYAEGNHATQNGGAAGGKVSFERSTLVNNSAANQGGCHSFASGHFLYNYCSGNDAQFGGGLHLVNFSQSKVISGNVIFENSSADGASFDLYADPTNCDETYLIDNYFGAGAPAAVASCVDPDATLDLSSTVSAPWPRCIDAPEAPTCVGATIRP